MTETLGAITATFSIFTDAHTPIEDEVRAILASRYLEPTRVRTRSYAGTAFVVVEQPGTNEAEACELLDQVRALEAVRSAELECRLERREAHARLGLPLTSAAARIDVV